MDRIYLDYAGSTPVDPRVHEAMRPYFSEMYGNPGGLHAFGQEAMAAIDMARATLKRILGVSDAGTVLFTGSATEGNNLALRGTVTAARRRRPVDAATEWRPKIVTSIIEHESILETCRDLEAEGAEVVYLPVNAEGVVDVRRLMEAVDEHTVLVSVMYANNQMGAIQPIAEIGAALAARRLETRSTCPLFHVDAVQGFQYLDCDVDALGVDYLTLSAQKIYGPKGVGALYVRHLEVLVPVITGGVQQEFGKRSGTENVPGIVGLAAAAEIATKMKEKEAARVAALRDRLWRQLRERLPNLELNGPEGARRTPNNLSIYFPGHAGQELIIGLDQNGLAVSTGAACSVRRAMPSYAIRALGHSADRAGQTIRISIGRQTTEDDIDEASRRITMVIEARAPSAVSGARS
jgi:cysteine desulfurase